MNRITAADVLLEMRNYGCPVARANPEAVDRDERREDDGQGDRKHDDLGRRLQERPRNA